MAKNTIIDKILSDWSVKSPSGIPDIHDIDGLHLCLESLFENDELVSELVNNYNCLVNELTIRENPGKDVVLTIKQSFIDKLKSINPELSSKLKEGDEIVRQPNTISDGEMIRISSSTLTKTSSPGDTSWLIQNLPGVVFYIDYTINVNSLLKRSSKKSEKLLSTDTEALHECFFVIALASQIDSQGTSMGLKVINSLKSLLEFVNSTKIMVKDKEKIIDVFSSRLTDGEFSSEVNLRKVDAQNCAESAYKRITELYNTPSFDYVTRVFEGSDGKKVVADASIMIGGETLSISLKYKKGQMNNLKCTTVIENLFGIQSGGKSMMDLIYEFDSVKIDELLRFFINGINKILPPKNQKYYVNGESLTYPVFKKIVSKNEYYPLAYTTISTDIVKLNQDAQSFVNDYKKMKSVNLSETITRFIETRKTDNKDFKKFLTYILRCEPEKSYMYVGDGGKSIYIIPSQNELSQRNITITSKPKTSADFTSNVSVFVDEILAFEFDIIFRWTKSQWVGDLSQVGKNLKAYEIDWG
jgi:hypothetical protein